MPESDINVARETFFAAELNTMVHKGERVRDGHPVLEGRELLFDKADTRVAFDVETVTAAPGEKRGQPSSPAPTPALPPEPASSSQPATLATLKSLSRQDLMKRAVTAGVPAKGSNPELIAAISVAEQKSDD